MAEEQVKDEDVKAAVQEAVSEEVVENEYSDVEQEAMQHGWNPEGVEGKKNLSAEEFMDRQPLYDDIRSLKKQYRKQQEALDALQEHHKHVKEREREKVISQLKQAKKDALEQDNYDAVVEIDEKINDAKTAPVEDASNPSFEEWVEKNEWYHDPENPDMRQYADMIGNGYFQQHPNKSVKEVYEYVAGEVRSRFPEKFSNKNRGKPTPVEGASKGSRTSPKSKYSAADLPEEHKGIMRTLVRSGVMSEEQYLKEYYE